MASNPQIHQRIAMGENEIDLSVSFTCLEIDQHENELGVQVEKGTQQPDPDTNIPISTSNDLNVVPQSEDNLVNAVDLNAHSSLEATDISQRGTRRAIRNLSNDQRRSIYHAVLMKSVDGRLKHGTTKMVASQFEISMRTAQRIWRRGKKCLTSCKSVDVSHKRLRNCGSKEVVIDLDRLSDIPLHKRTTIRSAAEQLETSKSTFHRIVNSGSTRRHSNAIKPLLKEENKKARLRFCISMLDANSMPHDPMFVDVFNVVHIDEKWFYMTKKTQNYYLLPAEEDPLRTCTSKNHITKVIFLTAIARPRLDVHGNEIFYGKIRIFPFITREPTKRTSANRVAGTLETKAITSVNRDLIKSYLIEKVLPAIRAKWPRDGSRSLIYIQQDNARTHIDPNDEDFRQAAAQDDLDIRLFCQPANSPDLNVLDLGFFSAIMSLQHKECPRTIDDLIAAVEKSFETFKTSKSNRIFLTLQMCMIEIMKAHGDNKYKIPHAKKEVLEIEGGLPIQVKCDPILVQNVINSLN